MEVGNPWLAMQLGGGVLSDVWKDFPSLGRHSAVGVGYSCLEMQWTRRAVSEAQ